MHLRNLVLAAAIISSCAQAQVDGGIGYPNVSDALKALFNDAARAASALGDADTAATLRQASTHWLRHSMLTNHANNGVQLKTLQETAGHASIATTAAYLHKTDNERHDEILASVNGNNIV